MTLISGLFQLQEDDEEGDDEEVTGNSDKQICHTYRSFFCNQELQQ